MNNLPKEIYAHIAEPFTETSDKSNGYWFDKSYEGMEKFISADVHRAALRRANDVIKRCQIALERTMIYATNDGVWINSRVKGSAMWGISDADHEIKQSFKVSAQLNEEALAAIAAYRAGDGGV